MPVCSAHAVEWKGRRGMRLSNGEIEITVLFGGGHIADFRLAGSPVNTLWESPWPIIEPQSFNPAIHGQLYGEGPAGKLLSGYTGHAIAIPYFGMPSDEQVAHGLPLHGEAAGAECKLANAAMGTDSASVTLEVDLVEAQLHFRRTLRVRAATRAVTVEESVRNWSATACEFQWVQHAAFGEPLFARNEASLFLSAQKGVTWPLGYEGHELLPNDTEFRWPTAPSMLGSVVDLSSPFVIDRTGFVAAVLVEPSRERGYIVVHNRRLALAAGYVFERMRFPWITLWEENRARASAPWNGTTRVRGVEFGTSPMPLGLDEARRRGPLFNTPTTMSLDAQATAETAYQMFATPVSPNWKAIDDVTVSANQLAIRSVNDVLTLSY